jgi:hypothetical protein
MWWYLPMYAATLLNDIWVAIMCQISSVRNSCQTCICKAVYLIIVFHTDTLLLHFNTKWAGGGWHALGGGRLAGDSFVSIGLGQKNMGRAPTKGGLAWWPRVLGIHHIPHAEMSMMPRADGDCSWGGRGLIYVLYPPSPCQIMCLCTCNNAGWGFLACPLIFLCELAYPPPKCWL